MDEKARICPCSSLTTRRTHTVDSIIRLKARKPVHARDADGYSVKANSIRMAYALSAGRSNAIGELCPGKAGEARTGRGFDMEAIFRADKSRTPHMGYRVSQRGISGMTGPLSEWDESRDARKTQSVPCAKCGWLFMPYELRDGLCPTCWREEHYMRSRPSMGPRGEQY